MEDISLKYAKYWRNSLADSINGRGIIQEREADKFLQIPLNQLRQEYIQNPDLIASLFDGQNKDVQTIEILVRPKVYQSILEHTVGNSNLPEIVTPLILSATLTRKGLIYPAQNTSIPRDLLAPLVDGAFVIGTVSQQDIFLTQYPPPKHTYSDPEGLKAQNVTSLWDQSLNHAEQLLKNVMSDLSELELNFQQTDYAYVSAKPPFTTAQILSLYDHICDKELQVPLFDRYTSQNTAEEPCINAQISFATRIGHSSDQYPLAQAQRDVLAHLTAMQEGDILAVNGPPGTGKTTLLLSVIAMLWAQATQQEAGEPPVIVAASTNNQAVTNIIEAFGKDFSDGISFADGKFAGRWLPDIKSFGGYYPSQYKQTGHTKYQTQEFFEEIENSEYVKHATVHYLAAAKNAFSDLNQPSVKNVVEKLQQYIAHEISQLEKLHQTYAALEAAKQVLHDELGNDPQEAMSARLKQANELEAEHQNFIQLQERLEIYLAHEPLFYRLFSWFPPIADKRRYRLKLFLKDDLPTGFNLNQFQNIKELDAVIQGHINQKSISLQAQHQLVEAGMAVIKTVETETEHWYQLLQRLKSSATAEQLQRSGCNKPEQEIHLLECDLLADLVIRFPIFLLSTHYWEGRWLLEMEQPIDPPTKTGLKAIQKRWRRRMKLTPCIVSTFYMLPSHMKGKRYDGKDGAGKNKYLDDYLFNFIDLLIVDEAGQVLPEVAGASMTLAKKALVIGDTLQIEPIWSIPTTVDIGNLIQTEIISSTNIQNDYEQVKELGKLASTGSVMLTAQQTCRYQYDADLARGLWLYEHRRCYDQIIGYCNELCYKGKLKPMRGLAPNNLLPSIGYLHINGVCQNKASGSKHNLTEAETIAAWLLAHKEKLEQHYYPKKLHEIIAVVTPFTGQVTAIKNACLKHGLDTQKTGLTVGTVHSLQGAERLVIIFSPTYSKHLDGRFIDNNNSMLNVAVSRAKDSFLVFGDMDLFEISKKTSLKSPRGLLASLLSSEGKLQFELIPRQDLGQSDFLRYANEHDKFLLERALAKATEQVQIVSPWINLNRIKEIGALDAMCQAIQRGVNITIYTDKDFNEKKLGSVQLKQLIAILNQYGIQVFCIHRIHSKLVLVDDSIYCVGSFNWFSAFRKETHEFYRYETSYVYTGDQVAKEIKTEREILEQRKISIY
ncbi:AAA domain-containing protein [Acinetobacter sp. 1000160]|uniref:AAA domain-containing protein n=1 Tax=Acinetobacter sp. 1000160 TaxID=1310800 RepID=UPI0004533FDF|nr:AAA domain-containing protein [Acinetobacter sp. 1000160]EXB45211.1 viral (Super1) RNA helicase family protein [Acinetobacter baumannii 146457]EYT14068.1 viral (Super1) RNA helicase family protein [Acinetobacter sp. 1000160]